MFNAGDALKRNRHRRNESSDQLIQVKTRRPAKPTIQEERKFSLKSNRNPDKRNLHKHKKKTPF